MTREDTPARFAITPRLRVRSRALAHVRGSGADVGDHHPARRGLGDARCRAASCRSDNLCAERADRALVGAEEAEADCGVRQVRRVLPRRLRPLPELLRQAQVRRPRCAPQLPPGLQTSPRLRAARRAPPKGPGNCARATNTPQTAPTDPAASRAHRATPRAPVAPPPPRKLLAPLISLDGSNGASASSR